MANVLFKQGLQTNLDKIRTDLTAKEGTFYLTTDTHRLYIGRITSSAQTAAACDAVPVNQGVTFVNSISNLPQVTNTNRQQYAGQFYYVGDKNILCVYNGTGNANGWVQINPNTDTKVDGVEYKVTTVNGVATVTTTVKYTTPDGQAGGGSVSDAFTIKGEGGAKVSSDGKAVTITGEQYELQSAVSNKTTTITLKSTSGEDDSEIKVVAGDHTKITKETNGNLKIDSDYNEVSKVEILNGDTATASKDGFSVKITDKSGWKAGLVDPIIAVGEDPDAAANRTHFTNGVATLPVYSKTDIDNLLKGFNAMEFKGVINAAPPTADVAIGDTYKVGASSIQFNNGGTSTKVNKGDLLIALGEETNGVITNNLHWEIITSGDDTIITYAGEAITHGIKITDNTGGLAAQFELEEGDAITLSDTDSTKSNKVKISHAEVTHTAQTATEVQNGVGSTKNIKAISGITVNKHGHVTGYTTTTYPILDTNGQMNAVNTQISTTNTGDNSSSTITNEVSVKHSDGSHITYASGGYQLNSSSLSITSTQAEIGADHKATKAATMTIDMVWGTF